MQKELPKGWVETEIDNLFYLVYGKGLLTKDLIEDGYDVYGANGVIGKYSKYLYKDSKVIISCRGAGCGIIHRTKPFAYVTSNSIVFDEIRANHINLDFIKYALESIDKDDVITGTAQPQITIQLLKNLHIPFPPLPEQQRIVAKLDTLFGHLDTLKTRLDHIPQLLKDFRQKVLTQAVTGKLTDEWREGKELEDAELLICRIADNKKHLVEKRIIKNESVKLDDRAGLKTDYYVEKWTWCRLIEIATLITDGKHGDCVDEPNSGYFFLSVKDMKEGKLSYSVAREIKKADFEEVHKRTNLEPGDILISSTGATIGKVAVAENIPETPKTTFQKSVAIVKNFKEYVISEYIKFFLLANLEGLRDIASGSAQPNLLLGDLKKFQIIIPPLKEQQEIVRRVESLFAKADQIEASYQKLKAKIEQLPQALLAKAFRGELVEQLATDGDARELLEQINQAKAGLEKGGKTNRLKVEEKVRMVAEKAAKYDSR